MTHSEGCAANVTKRWLTTLHFLSYSKAVEIPKDLRFVQLGKVFVLEGRVVMEPRDVAMVLSMLSDAAKTAGEPLEYWIVLPPDAQPPPAAVREAMQAATKTLWQHCEKITIVLLGEGLQALMIRTVLRGMTMMGGHRDHVRVVATLAEAAQSAPNGKSLLKAIHAAGIKGERAVSESIHPGR